MSDSNKRRDEGLLVSKVSEKPITQLSLDDSTKYVGPGLKSIGMPAMMPRVTVPVQMAESRHNRDDNFIDEGPHPLPSDDEKPYQAPTPPVAASRNEAHPYLPIAGKLWKEYHQKAVPGAADADDLTPVILETPYAGDIEFNVAYARACMADCLLNHKEAPYASHLLYTQPGVLNDAIPEERRLGIRAGFAFRSLVKKTVVYVDLGVSKGMQEGMLHASKLGHPVEVRSLPDFNIWLSSFEAQREATARRKYANGGTRDV